MAVSFFSFIRLVSIAPLSFAVPVSAATLIPETILARLFLGEQGRLAPMGRRRTDRRGRGADLAMIAAILVCCGAIYNLLAIAGALRFRRAGRDSRLSGRLFRYSSLYVAGMPDSMRLFAHTLLRIIRNSRLLFGVRPTG